MLAWRRVPRQQHEVERTVCGEVMYKLWKCEGTMRLCSLSSGACVDNIVWCCDAPRAAGA